MNAEQRIADLEAEVRTLKAVLGLGVRFPSIFQFTKREQRLLGILTKQQVMTHDMMIYAVYGDEVDGGADWAQRSLYVGMCALRKKLKRFDIHIKSLFGIGYEITPAEQKLLREIMIKETS